MRSVYSEIDGRFVNRLVIKCHRIHSSYQHRQQSAAALKVWSEMVRELRPVRDSWAQGWYNRLGSHGHNHST
jgi:hypothetical protein